MVVRNSSLISVGVQSVVGAIVNLDSAIIASVWNLGNVMRARLTSDKADDRTVMALSDCPSGELLLLKSKFGKLVFRGGIGGGGGGSTLDRFDSVVASSFDNVKDKDRVEKGLGLKLMLGRSSFDERKKEKNACRPH